MVNNFLSTDRAMRPSVTKFVQTNFVRIYKINVQKLKARRITVRMHGSYWAQVAIRVRVGVHERAFAIFSTNNYIGIGAQFASWIPTSRFPLKDSAQKLAVSLPCLRI